MCAARTTHLLTPPNLPETEDKRELLVVPDARSTLNAVRRTNLGSILTGCTDGLATVSDLDSSTSGAHTHLVLFDGPFATERTARSASLKCVVLKTAADRFVSATSRAAVLPYAVRPLDAELRRSS